MKADRRKRSLQKKSHSQPQEQRSSVAIEQLPVFVFRQQLNRTANCANCTKLSSAPTRLTIVRRLPLLELRASVAAATAATAAAALGPNTRSRSFFIFVSPFSAFGSTSFVCFNFSAQALQFVEQRNCCDLQMEFD